MVADRADGSADEDQFWPHISAMITRGADVALDASALLRLWKGDDDECVDLVQRLTELGEQVFLPYQALREVRRLAPGIREATIKDLNTQLAVTLRRFAQVEFEMRRDRAHFGLEPAFFRQVVTNIGEVKASLCHLFDNRKAEFGKTALAAERFLERIQRSSLRIGEAPGAAEAEERERTARLMIKHREPPGSAVKGSTPPESRRLGDCLIWLELLQEARRRGRDIVFVTTDHKSNGWVVWRRNGTMETNPGLVTLMNELGVQFTVVSVRNLIGARSANSSPPRLRPAAGAENDHRGTVRPLSLFTDWAEDDH